MASVHSSSDTAVGGSFLHQSPTNGFTPEMFSSDERLMAETALQFSKREVIPYLERLDAQEDRLMPSLVRKACDLGFGGPDSPEEFGGLGLSKAVGMRILEMLSLNGSFSTTIGVQMGIAQAPLILFGSEAQQRRLLPKLISGEWIGAYALSEPNSGTDALNLSTRATVQDGKYELTGTKMWISNAKWADLFTVFAKVDGERLSAFLVERSAAGVDVSREEHKMGLKGSSTARLVLERAEVPVENLLYLEGMGHKVALNALNLGRCRIGSMALGQARAAMHEGAKYARERKQFGRPIANFGAIRDKLSRMCAEMYASESALYLTANLIDLSLSRRNPNGNASEENRKACEEFQIECSLVKVLTTEALDYIVDESLQIHGGYGFTEEFPIARMYRDARVMRIYEGTNEINRIFAFDRVAKQGLLAKLNESSPTCEAHRLLIQASRSVNPAESSPQELVTRMSDLLVITFAQQAAYHRAAVAKERGESNACLIESAARLYEAISTPKAAAAAAEVISRSSGSGSVTLPILPHDGSLADAVLESTGYPI